MFLNGLGLCAELRRILVTPAIARNLESGAFRAWPLACRKAKGRLFRTRSFPTARTRIKEKAPPRTGPGSPLQHQIGVRKELLSSRLPRQFGAREMVPEARGEPCLLAQSSGRHPLLACPRQRPGTQYAGKR